MNTNYTITYSCYRNSTSYNIDKYLMTCKRILAEKPDDESAKASLKALEDIMSERKIIDAHFVQMPFGTDYALVNAAKDAGIRLSYITGLESGSRHGYVYFRSYGQDRRAEFDRFGKEYRFAGFD